MEPPKIEVLHCFLCYKDPFITPCDGGFVRFSDFQEDQSELSFGSRHDEKWFCEEHLLAAQALTHLSAQEALNELQKDYGVFKNSAIERMPMPFWLRVPDFVYIALAIIFSCMVLALLVNL